jgi:hexosaminidase
MRFLIAVISFFALGLATFAQVEPRLSLMPMPSSVQPASGEMVIDRSFSVETAGASDPVLDRGVKRFTDQLSRRTGIFLFQKSSDATKHTITIHVDHASEKVQKLETDESYQLVIENGSAKLNAPNTLGALHGLETFLQLVKPGKTGFSVPAMTINDHPRFAWRGMLIDVGRHFIPPDALKRNLDAMAAAKMNVLHWHLYDDQGFRIESKKFPKLQEQGSDGLYYTQDEIRDLISYAHDRGIRIMPEFEMPGHSRSMFVGYPELASGPGPYRVEPGAPDAAMDPTREETYKFLDKFLEEMSKLFPDEYVHIGGDEVNGHQWDTNPKIQEYIHAHGMKNNQDLQAYFNQRLQKILSKYHKVMVGWDEVLHPDLPKTVVVQSWRGQESLATAARQGYRGLLSFGYYLDLIWPASRHYAVDPMSGQAASLTPEEKKRILGGESCMWSEWVTPENIDERIWPRNAAIAERLWSPPEVQDPASMYERLAEFSQRLEYLGLQHQSTIGLALRRMSGRADDVSSVETLAAVVEPVRDYTRMESLKGTWDFRAPLNRLVDVVPPESETALGFGSAVQAYLQSGGKDRAAAEKVRAQLTLWRDNDARLHPVLEQSYLLQELSPLSADLSTLGAAGLFALDYLDRSTPTPATWRAQQAALLEMASTPKADLLLVVVAPVRRLIEASASPSAASANVP